MNFQNVLAFNTKSLIITIKTKLKDMNGVNDIALGWAINFRIARFIKFSIGTTLTDSVFGDDIGMTTISIGVGL